MYVCKRRREIGKYGNAYVEKVKAAVKEENAQVLVISATNRIGNSTVRVVRRATMFLDDLGLKESGVTQLIKAAYRLLNLATYFTAGVQEVRAWTIHKVLLPPKPQALSIPILKKASYVLK